MYLLYTDESNLEPSRAADFFIYGGVVVSHRTARGLSEGVDRIRKRYGYRAGDKLKFTVHEKERPAHISREAHICCKSEILDLASQKQVCFLVSMVHHGITAGVETAREFAINRVCWGFDKLLGEKDREGLVLVDTYSNHDFHKMLADKFHHGLRFGGRKPGKRMQNILGFHISTLSGSHFGSVLDVVLGSFRFAVNNRGEPGRKETVDKIMSKVSPLFIRQSPGRKVRPESLDLSPKTLKAREYRDKYAALRSFLAQYGLDP